MTKLRVADGLAFSSDASTQTIAVLGNRGSGKTYGAAVLAEEMLATKQQLVVIDPLGVWWGLRSSADGKEPGYPIVIVGGEHADVPVEETGGKLAADFVVDSGRSVILDLVLLRKGAQKRFMLDFAEQLYHRCRSALHVMVDEADAFAPQRPQRGDERLLGAIEDWVRRGRARGIGVTLITQRSAVLNKNVLELAETLLIFRTTGPRSIDAIMAWVEHHGVEEQAAAMLTEMPKLDTGDAFVWSPSYLDVFKRVHIRQRTTFDSSATPKPGERQRSVKSVAAVDLEKLSTDMKASADRAKADDPKELRKRIAELEKQAKIAVRPAVDQVAIDRAVSDAVNLVTGQLNRAWASAIADERKRIEAAVKSAFASEAWNPPELTNTVPITSTSALRSPVTPRRPERSVRPVVVPPPSSDGVREISNPQRAMLDALVSFESVGLDDLALGQLAVYSDQSPKSSGFRNNVSALCAGGYLERLAGRRIRLTDAGRALGTVSAPATLDDLHDAWRRKLSGPQATMLDIAIREHPHGVDRDELARASGQSPLSSGYRNNLSVLSALGLVRRAGRDIAATPLLFPDGLR